MISRIEAADAVSAAQTAEMQAREPHHFEEEHISASVRAVLDEIRRLCDGVEYKVPGKHETWEDEQVRNAANLIDSAALHYRENPGATLREAIKVSCDQDNDDPLGCIQD